MGGGMLTKKGGMLWPLQRGHTLFYFIPGKHAHNKRKHGTRNAMFSFNELSQKLETVKPRKKTDVLETGV
jgi:hypothetical protein